MDEPAATTDLEDERVTAFWEVARFHARLNDIPSYFGRTALESLPPPVWSFGGTPEEGDRMLTELLDGRRTCSVTRRSEYVEGPMPEVGTLGIVTDAAGRPRALVANTQVRFLPFSEVSDPAARADGVLDGLGPDDPVVLEVFTVLHQA